MAMSFISIAGAQAASRRVVLSPGSVIPVRLDQSLSSKTARVGDRFTATVRYGQDAAGLPEGTRVEGVVREAVSSANGKPGVLDMDFRRMVTPGGQVRTLTGSLIALDARSVQRSESGRMVATADKSKERLKFIGIGAGAGLLVSVLTKGDRLTDTLLGAAAGYLYNEFGNKPKPGNVNLKAGTEFGVRLDRELVFQTHQPDTSLAAAQSHKGRDPASLPNDRTADMLTEGSSAAIGMRINDQNVTFDTDQPFMRNGVSFVPLEPVAKAANFDYSYVPNQKMIRARNGDLRMGIGSRIAVLNGARRRLNAAPEVRNGAVYVPMQFIGLATGGSVHWDASSRTVVLTGVPDAPGPSDSSGGSTDSGSTGGGP